MCAIQAATALVAVAGAGIGLSFLDPIAALVIAGIALKEGRDGWRGQDTCCTPMLGWTPQRARPPRPRATKTAAPDDTPAYAHDHGRVHGTPMARHEVA